MTRVYSEAAVEVLDILDHTVEEKVNLIPQKFINYLKENAAKDYVAKLDYSKPINEMNIKIETKGILGTICRNWWWNEKDELLVRIRVQTRMNKEREEKYKIGNITFNKKSLEISKDSVTLNINEKESQVLDFLIKNQKSQASKEDIAKKIWNGEDFEKIPMYIEFLQEKLIALNANIRINEDNGYRLDNIYKINL